VQYFLHLHIFISLNYFYIFSHLYYSVIYLLRATFLSGCLDMFRHAEVNVILHVVSQTNLSVSIPAKTSSRDKTTFRAKTQKGLCLSFPFCHLKPRFDHLSCIQQNELAVYNSES